MNLTRTAGRRILLLVCISFALHLAYLASPLPKWNYYRMDEAIYWDLASNLAHKGSLSLSNSVFATTVAGEKTLFWTPVYPGILALIIKTGLPAQRVLQLFQIILTSLLPLVFYPVAYKLLRGKWLWIFLGLTAVYPYYFQLSTQCGSEILALFQSVCCLALALSPKWKSWLNLFLLGVMSAALALNRPEYLAFSLVLLAWTSLHLFLEMKYNFILPVFILALSFSILMGAWLFRNYQIADRIIYTTRPGWGLVYENEYYQSYTQGEIGSEEEWLQTFPVFPTEIQRFEYLRDRAKSYIIKHPLTYAKLCLKRTISLALPAPVKTILYAVFGKRDIKSFQAPIWIQLSNGVFLLFFWLLVLPSCLRFFWQKKFRLKFLLSPAGLICMLILGQLSVYTLFAYIEYQRSIIDLEIILVGCWFFLNIKSTAPVPPEEF